MIFLFALLLTVGTSAYFIRDEMKVGFPFSWKKAAAALLLIFPYYVGVLSIFARCWSLIALGWVLTR